MTESIFITGATGCVGHYVIEKLLRDYPDYELHLLVRKPERLKVALPENARVTFHKGTLDKIDAMEPVIKKMTYLIHIATCWDDSTNADFINVEQTHKMFDFCDPAVCKKIIYYSTASIIGPGNVPVPEAETAGTGYVRSKYLGHHALPKCKLYDRIITVFPTLVWGGNNRAPWSHISSGVIPCLTYLKVLRFFSVDAGFHFIHAEDMATLTLHFLFNDMTKNEYVMGNAAITANEALAVLCKTFQVRRYFTVPIRPWVIRFLATVFRIKIGPWDQYCLDHPQMVFDTVSPDTFGLKTAFPTLEILLEDVKKMQSKNT